jgi:hypothetical protein
METAPPTNPPENQPAAPSVAAIVLSYNGKDLVLATVPSLLAVDYPNLDVIVVDNGSTDGTAEALAEAHPEVEVLRCEQNQWISGGLNVGIRHALAAGYDYLLLLNNDIEVDPGMVRELVAVAESDSTIGCVGPKAYYFSERNRLWSAGGKLSFREAMTRERGMREIDRGQYDRTEEVDYINGCAMLVPRRVQLQTGLWDTNYNICVEDADWCMRAKRLGYRCVYAHRAVLWHMVSPTTGGYTPGRTFQTARSTAIFVRKFANPFEWLRFLAFFTAAIPAAFLRELPKGNQAAALAKVRGLIAGLRMPIEPVPPLEVPSAD